MNVSRLDVAIRVALVAGGLVDLGVAALALFFPAALGPLLDAPATDPLFTSIAGAETAVVASVYAFAFFGYPKLRAILYVPALDQAFAIVVPALAIVHHTMPASAKTIGPMPLNLALLAIFVAGARARS